ncbi:hypothetical protein APY03_5962 [Variovorax sp. WDL1]|nr:hypothetical protein APY03_5962 [Variovorax sp. WDL1]
MVPHAPICLVHVLCCPLPVDEAALRRRRAIAMSTKVCILTQ